MKTLEQRIEEMRAMSCEELIDLMSRCGTKTSFKYNLFRSTRTPAEFIRVIEEKGLSEQFEELGVRQKIVPYSKGGPAKLCQECGDSEENVYFAKGRRVCRPCQNTRWDSRRELEGLEPYSERRKAKMRHSAASRKKIFKDLDYNSLYEEQKGLCAVCLSPEKRKTKLGEIRKLAVDHCHKTGRVRRLLCADCNTGIGLFRDNAEFLRRAADYLDAHR